MENLKIHSKLVSLEEQLEILESARHILLDEAAALGYCDGLCAAIDNSLDSNLKSFEYGYYGYIQRVIPLFTHANAIKYCGGSSFTFWWPPYLRDIGNPPIPNLAPRLAMLDWMEGLIKKEINKQK